MWKLHRAGLFLPPRLGPWTQRGLCACMPLPRLTETWTDPVFTLPLLERPSASFQRLLSSQFNSRLPVVEVFLTSSAPLLSESANEPRASATQRRTDLQETRVSGKHCIGPFTKQVLENALNTLIVGHILVLLTSSYKSQISCTLRRRAGAPEPKEPCDGRLASDRQLAKHLSGCVYQGVSGR